MSEQVKDPLIFETSYRKDTAAHLDEEIEKRYPGKYHEQELLTDYPTVYIIDNQGKQSDYKEDYTVYVGETIDIQRRTMKDNSKQRFGEQLLHNELNVLLTRGVHGLYLHAVDPQLQAALKRAALDQRHN